MIVSEARTVPQSVARGGEGGQGGGGGAPTSPSTNPYGNFAFSGPTDESLDDIIRCGGGLGGGGRALCEGMEGGGSARLG